MQLKITKHAQGKMSAFAISKDMIKDAIKGGAKFKQTDGLLVKYKYFSVAYKKIGKDVYKIKTVYENK